MEYTIKRNEQFNSLEIAFAGKPSEAVRDALKSLRFRWHGVKKLWYGYADEDKVRAAIDGITETPVEKPVYEITPTDAYMGSVGFVGSNAGKRLYGAELAQAIREAIKGDGIKGVTVAKDTYSMGQSITLTVKLTDADILTLDQYVENTNIFDFAAFGWIEDTDDHDRQVNQFEVNYWSGEKQERVHRELAKRGLDSVRDGRRSVSPYHIDSYKYFTDAFKAKLHRVVLIAQSFNYDDSNSMVDYYDVNFSLSVYTKF